MTFLSTTPPPRPQDAKRDDRSAVLRAMRLDGPDPNLDEFARRLAREAGTPYAMVNIFGSGEQQFLGLCTPDEHSTFPSVGRSMSLDHGFCPEVVERRNALVLPDVFASPRFASNAVVDLINIRTYAGAPLIHHTGVVLGTVCFVGPQAQPTSTGQASLVLIKQQRDEVMNYLYRRTGNQMPQ
ncbi:GAF domain-containing protein [Streptomyces sp. NPDC088246]|uniref:GAF domain-containing protein n=1 Tax=Streptomyces sp. NPDC088246 TaxID=3365842 RepID=UPI003802334F